MTKDVDELVRDAFRIEHREQLEQIRTLLGSLHAGDDVAHEPRIQDAFRLAHSFKGGARVCDLRDAERLGHALESVLEQLNQGEIRLNDQVTKAVHAVLDSIEDWMAALDTELALPDISDVLAGVDRVLGAKAESTTAASKADTTTARLRSAFRTEYAEQSAQLGQLLAKWNAGEAASHDDISVAHRAAHVLAGAAALVDMPSIESVARRLEDLFQAVHNNQRRLDADALQLVEQELKEMALAARGLAGELEAINEPGGSSPVSIGSSARQTIESPGSPTCESVRVSVESLDRLVRSSNELLSDNQQTTRIARQVTLLQRDVGELNRERDTLRRSASSKLHQLSAMPEFGRISRYIEYVDRQVGKLAKRTRQLALDHRAMAWQLRTHSAQIERNVFAARLVPAHSVFQGFRKMVRELAKSEAKQIEFQAEGMDVRADRMVLQELKDSIMHALRNCISHGIEGPEDRREKGKPKIGHISLDLDIADGRLNVVIEDDGLGFDLAHIQQRAIRAGLLTNTVATPPSANDILATLFEPGFSTADTVTELAGRGMGLSAVREAARRLQGEARLMPRPEGGARICISVPMFVSTHRVLLVTYGKQTIAIPTRAIKRLLRISKNKIETLEGQPVVMHQGGPVRLVRLADLLGHSHGVVDAGRDSTVSVVLLRSEARLLAISVDALLEKRDALILNLDAFASARLWAGGILLEDGRVALVVEPAAMIERAPHDGAVFADNSPTQPAHSGPNRVLIVDDSFTTRTLEKSILEAEGFEVSVAVDGVEAMTQLRQQKFGLVISDIEMPRMDGFALLEQIKSDRQLAKTPVILVTSRDRQDDQKRGLDLGANAYIVKRKFDHHELLKTVRQLL